MFIGINFNVLSLNFYFPIFFNIPLNIIIALDHRYNIIVQLFIQLNFQILVELNSYFQPSIPLTHLLRLKHNIYVAIQKFICNLNIIKLLRNVIAVLLLA